MKRILLIDNSRPTKNGGIGGSINSMLQLIARINKSQFKIYVLLYYKLPLLENQLRKIEVTMIHGGKDEVVPKSYSTKVLKIFNKAKKKLVIIKNGDHSLSNKSDLKKINLELNKIVSNIT